MTTPPVEALDAALLLADALEARAVPYAIGGALAYGLWGVPRATVDLDVNVFVDESGLAAVFDALTALGVQVDAATARASAEATGMFAVPWGAFRVDLFTPSVPFSWEAMRTRVRITVEGRAAWFLSAESIAVFKLLFFRTKDVADLERLVATQGDALDVAGVRRHVVAMMGEDDERVRRWDALTGRAAG